MNNYLKINNLSYSYPDGHKALSSVSFSIDQGESISILGPNGAGKTTLILHLNGILGQLSGEIEVSGLKYIPDNIDKIRKTVGVVFQDPDDQLFMPTVIEEEMYGPKNNGFTQKPIIYYEEKVSLCATQGMKQEEDFEQLGDYKYKRIK